MPTTDKGLAVDQFDNCFNCGEPVVLEFGRVGRFVHEVDGYRYFKCHDRPKQEASSD